MRLVAGAAFALATGVVLGLEPASAQAMREGDESLTLDQAIQRTLERNPRVSVRRLQVDEAEGKVTAAAGTFDWTLTGQGGIDRLQRPYLDTTLRELTQTDTRTDTLSMGVKKTFRNSVSASLTQSYLTSREKYYNPFGTVATLTWAMTVTVPLLRGFGEDYATANERSSVATYEATQYTSAHEITREIFATALLYWDSLAQQQNIDALDAIMLRARSTAEILAERQRAGELAPVDYQRSLAELRLRENDLEDGLQLYRANRRQLAAQLGGVVDGQVPLVVSAFPEPAPVEQLKAYDLNAVIAGASDRRLDRKAMKKNQNAAQIALDKAENDLLPQLDLQLSGQYNKGLAQYDMGRLGEMYHGSARLGPSAGASLVFTYPLGNNAAEGTVSSNKAALTQYYKRLDDIDNALGADVAIALDKLRTNASTYRRAVEATAMIDEVARETTRKLSLGETTMTDVLSVESRLLDSRLRVIQIKQNYAKALSEFRFVTGTLADGDYRTLTIDSRALTTLPGVP